MQDELIKIPSGKGLEVEAVLEEGIAAEVGIEAGDRLLSVNGNLLRDIIDYKYHVAEERLEINVLKRDGSLLQVEIEKGIDDSLGLEFPGMRIRQCPNKCVFCFVDQNPEGQRKALYIRDEDYRFSFMYGNYITLTNLSRRDRERIFEQRLSPLYVSVHATDNQLRRELLKNPKAPDILATLREFIDHGITLQTQIVICPGLNDGEHLARSIQELAALYPGVASLAVVPVGLTKHRKDLFEIKEVTDTYAREMIRILRPWQERYLSELGSAFVFPSDEFYIRANIPFPPLEQYEGLLQIENGVGMVPLFLKEALEWLEALPRGLSKPKRISLVTGTSFAGHFREILSQVHVEGLTLQLYPIENEFLGQSVTVAGLLTGGDLIKALREEDLGDLLVIPSVALNEEGKLFLDNTTPQDVSERLGVPVRIVDSKSRGLWELMEAVYEDFGQDAICGHHRTSR